MKLRRNKTEERASKLLLRELFYFKFRGNLALHHGQFNDSISFDWWPRRNLDKLNSLYDLDIFSINSNLNAYLNTEFNLISALGIWLSLYLKTRKQTTQVGHHISDKAVVGCGVPQGSILGPFFSNFLNKLHTILRKIVVFHRI